MDMTSSVFPNSTGALASSCSFKNMRIGSLSRCRLQEFTNDVNQVINDNFHPAKSSSLSVIIPISSHQQHTADDTPDSHLLAASYRASYSTMKQCKLYMQQDQDFNHPMPHPECIYCTTGTCRRTTSF